MFPNSMRRLYPLMDDPMVVGQRWNVTLLGCFAGNLAVLNFGSLMAEKWVSLVLLPSGVDEYGSPFLGRGNCFLEKVGFAE